MRRRQLKWLWARLAQLQTMEFSRDALLMKLGSAQSKIPAAWRLVEVNVEKTGAAFTYRLNRKKEAIRTLKSDLAIRPIFHQDPSRADNADGSQVALGLWRFSHGVGEGIADENAEGRHDSEPERSQGTAISQWPNQQRQDDGNAELPSNDVPRRKGEHAAATVAPPVDAARHLLVVGNISRTQSADEQEPPGPVALPQAQTQIAKLHRNHFPRERHPEGRTPQHGSTTG
jgi:hypothetical protein